MNKLKLSIILMIVFCITTGCHKSVLTDNDKERTDYVKKMLLSYGMEIVAEVTPQNLDKNNRNTNDLISFGKNQIYELSCGKRNEEEANTVFYHKFKNSKKGQNEAQKLYEIFKDSIKVLPDSSTKETIDRETGNKSFTSRSKNSNSIGTADLSKEETTANEKETKYNTEILVVLIYNAEYNEVIEMTTEEKLPSDHIEDMIEKEMKDMGWTY